MPGKKVWVLAVMLGILTVTASAAGQGVLRCGWFDNPTPNNAWLIDRDGEWTISEQGGHQAEGDWPSLNGRQWVATNGSHGHGCACMRVIAIPGSHDIARILSTQAKPLQQCRKDPALRGKEPS